MINLTTTNNINNELKTNLIENGFNELIVNLLVNRGYDAELIETLLSTGYSETMPRYNDLINVEIGADIIQSHIANNSTIYILINLCFRLLRDKSTNFRPNRATFVNYFSYWSNLFLL
jgi:hypothetical protein